MSIEEAYDQVQTYQDLLTINLKFLNGIYNYTCYHGGPVCSETLPLLYDLKILNKLGYYTHNGQPSSSKTSFILSDESSEFRTFNRVYTCWQQRGYLCGYIQLSNIKNLKTFLKAQDVYYSIEYPCNGITETNIPFDRYRNKNYFSLIRSMNFLSNDENIIDIPDNTWNISYMTSIPDGSTRYEVDELHLFPIMKILQDCISLTITTVDYNSTVNLEKLMIQYFLEN